MRYAGSLGRFCILKSPNVSVVQLSKAQLHSPIDDDWQKLGEENAYSADEYLGSDSVKNWAYSRRQLGGLECLLMIDQVFMYLWQRRRGTGLLFGQERKGETSMHPLVEFLAARFQETLLVVTLEKMERRALEPSWRSMN